MTADDTVVGAMGWAALIQAVAVRRDRAAFARLFEYFAPRIKAYMQRSGATDASAEELAQETMPAAWRKAETQGSGTYSTVLRQLCRDHTVQGTSSNIRSLSGGHVPRLLTTGFG